ncbi:DUF808 domain-containing protein [Aliiglaciecola sp. 2_MG-2023]|uniref:DUF808 domain-containing protein n=1 Tax=unclassified Aliiglaciecola TaxID=2593648 RepID=UPI0026E39A6B|nr:MULTISPECIES: DUF808 domain-containing protein [unclassified Aliiglaciecola]MDO6709681.1 DUF808 domain-containing protein [Aliiglaciecola sp. 2_MG-2023]MDO6750777.1 DUF808 domain-containing protein [Aliiglaciecola sp. 1_MG-2023]
MVWAVAKGSFLNKLILVPAALAISAFLPVLITVLMVIGGLYLSFEGFEKVFHKFFHSKAELQAEHAEKIKALADPNVDLVALEKDKIKGAIRTDFILSAEIIVIVLGTVKDEVFMTQLAVVSGLALLITVGVYGLVAGIVKLDDLGLYLLRKSITGKFDTLQRTLGRGLLMFAPMLMKTLAIVGTAAMFLVGGGILVHSIPTVHHVVHEIVAWLETLFGSVSQSVAPILLEGLTGVMAGAVVMLVVTFATKLKNLPKMK